MSKLQDDENKIQEKIGYKFNNIDLFYQAFTRSSYSAECGIENNEVLEFIGDSVLNFYVTKIISDKFGFMKPESKYYDRHNDYDEYCIIANKNEADFSELRKQIVSNSNLSKQIDQLGFAECLFMSDSD
ncbi:ribonuclease III family protein [bacterium]|nr:ribonuclease III family protein [bacterium]